MNRQYLWIVSLAAVAFASSGVTACGDDPASSANGGTGGTGQPSLARTACETFCVKADACDLTKTVDDCKRETCAKLDTAAAACQGATKAYFDCANGLSDACETSSCAALQTITRQSCGG